MAQVAEETRAARARSRSLGGAGGRKQGIRYGGQLVWGHGASATPLHDDRGQCQAIRGAGKQRQKRGTGLRMQQLLLKHHSMDHHTLASQDAVVLLRAMARGHYVRGEPGCLTLQTSRKTGTRHCHLLVDQLHWSPLVFAPCGAISVQKFVFLLIC